MDQNDLFKYLDKLTKKCVDLSLIIKKKMNLTQPEIKLIQYLYSHNNLASASAIAKDHEVTIAAIMRYLAILEKKGLVNRSVYEDDNRFKYYSLTDSGLKLAIKLDELFKDIVSQYLEYLGEDVDAFSRIVDKTIKFMEAYDD